MDPYAQKNTRWGGGVQGTKIIHPTIQAHQQQLALQQQLQQQQGQIRTQIASAGSQSEQRVFTGTVTKIHDNFGFIDDDVFFQLVACEGKSPVIGDRVLVDAQYNPNMPFKWNASRVQVIVAQPQTQQVTQLQNTAQFTYQSNMMQTQQQSRGGQAQSLYSTQLQNQRLAQQQGLKFSGGHGGAGLLGPAPAAVMNAHITPQRVQQNTPKRNAPRPARERRPSPPRRPRVKSRSIEKEPRKRRSRTPPPRRRSPSPVRCRSVSSEKVARHPLPRYLVQYAKYPLTRKASDVLELGSLFPNLYIPSDFTNIHYTWLDSVLLQQPLTFEKCQFHIMNKDVERLDGTGEQFLDPTDASHSWTARVMLLQVPGKEEFYKQCCSLAEDNSDHFVHPTRCYQFLLGYKSKKEPMAIGGMWSPSLDGPDPASNPRTLINTAIRTCKALTGINLSKCTKWYRIAEIQYHRAAEVRKGRSLPERLETTIMFLPDVRSCMPTAAEYSALRGSYLAKYETVINREDKSEDIVATTDTTATENNKNITPDDNNDVIAADAQREQKSREEPTSKDEKDGSVEEMEQDEKEGKQVARDEIEEEVKKVAPLPTQLTDSEIKTLKVDSLRKELESRGLSPKGLKSQLVTRLTKAVKEEVEKQEQEKSKEEEKKQDDSMDISEAVPVDEKSRQAEVKDKDSVLDDNARHEGEDKEIKMEPDSQKKEEDQKGENEVKKIRKTEDDHRLKRHYALDSKPAVVVHPSTIYRKGKFECATASLFNLLNYKQEDNKESMFEVSVFAEAFKEMLQRDFAFTIYKSFADPMPEIKIEKEPDAGESTEGEERKRSRVSEDDEEPKTKKSKSVSDDKEKGDEEEKSEEKPKGRSQEPDKEEKSDCTRSGSRESKDSKRHDKSSHDRDSKKTDKSKSRGRHSKENMITVRPELLLACVYFDRTHCGYIRESDLTDIIHTAGLDLSRSQLSKIIAPTMVREHFFYRKMTDVPEKQQEAFNQLLQTIEKKDCAVLAVGNKNLSSAQCQQINGTSKPSDSEDGFVIFKGALVDVGSLMEKLNNSENNRVELESSLTKLESKLESIKRELTKSQKDYKTVESDYEATKKKFSESQSSYKSASDWKTKYEKTLKNIVAVAEDVLPKHPKKE